MSFKAVSDFIPSGEGSGLQRKSVHGLRTVLEMRLGWSRVPWSMRQPHWCVDASTDTDSQLSWSLMSACARTQAVVDRKSVR